MDGLLIITIPDNGMTCEEAQQLVDNLMLWSPRLHVHVITSKVDTMQYKLIRNKKQIRTEYMKLKKQMQKYDICDPT